MDIMRIGAIAILGVLLGLIFKGGKQEYAVYIGVGVSLMIFVCAAAYLGQVRDQLYSLQQYVSSGSKYFALLFKIVGITWICEFVAGVCRDSGFASVASQIELFGKIAILFAGMPVFLSLVETIAGFVG